MNAPLLSAPRVEPFFFDADSGTRFSLYHAPAPHLPPRGAILHVHPFAEELNRTRRLASLQAHRFAALGFAVLQIDLFGCGDSCGDFQSARWDLWKRDLATARDWLAERSEGPLWLWGVRLGGLLALDFAQIAPVDGILLWQPYLNGRTCINQFLRQRLAAQASGSKLPNSRSTSGLRAELLAHGMLEVNGYELAAPLAQAIDACDAADITLPPCPVHWFASGAPAPTRMRALAARLSKRWGEHGTTLHLHAMDFPSFWSGTDNTGCDLLMDATCASFAPDTR